VLNFAIKSGYVGHNPCAIADRPRLPAREPVKPPTPVVVEGIRRTLEERDRPVTRRSLPRLRTPDFARMKRCS